MRNQSKVLTYQKTSASPSKLPNKPSTGSGRWLQRTGSKSSPSMTWSQSQESGKPFLKPQPSTRSKVWQHWRQKSQPIKVEGCFRHCCQQLQQGPSGSQQDWRGSTGRGAWKVKTTPCKGKSPTLAAGSLPAGPCQKGNLPPEGEFSSVMICLFSSSKTQKVQCLKTAHFCYISQPLPMFFLNAKLHGLNPQVLSFSSCKTVFLNTQQSWKESKDQTHTEFFKIRFIDKSTITKSHCLTFKKNAILRTIWNVVKTLQGFLLRWQIH